MARRRQKGRAARFRRCFDLNLLNRKIDEFCYRHPRFGVPNLMKVIVIGTAIVYFLYLLTGYNYSAISFLTFDLGSLLRGEIWRLITFVFVPTSFQPFFLIISLFFYYFIGTALEREWGTAKFNIYYFGGMALSLAGVILASLFTGQDYVLSSTYYVNMSMFFAFAMLYPDATVLLLIVPVKIKYLAWLDAALFALSIAGSLIRLDIVGALLPVIALLNFLVFFGADLMAWVGRKSGAAAHRTSPKTIRYKKAVREQMKEKGYHHKCAVCGKTDTDYPNLEFRYCSKCNGYYCYCSEHINNHVHIVDQP